VVQLGFPENRWQLQQTKMQEISAANTSFLTYCKVGYTEKCFQKKNAAVRRAGLTRGESPSATTNSERLSHSASSLDCPTM
jgi:hypothetical protein